MAALTFAFDACQTRFKATIERHGTTLELLGTLFHRSARRLFVSNRMVAGITLSPREFQCLEWSARGKTAWEISVILGISRRTVAYHLDNAKRKLGVHSIAEAVARLVAATATAL